MASAFPDDDASSDDEFHDASGVDGCHSFTIPARITTLNEAHNLRAACAEAEVSLHFILSNDFKSCEERLLPWVNDSMVHSVGYATVQFLQAMMTFEPDQIAEAANAAKRAGEICNRNKKRSSWFFGRNDSFTEAEAHAELLYAECILLQALLTFMESEHISSFIKGGHKIRLAYNSYKTCHGIMESQEFTEVSVRDHFHSGVHLGFGAFNLMISQLPERVLMVLSWLGFRGDKKVGFDHLQTGCSMNTGLRVPLCSMVLLTYHLFAVYYFGSGDGDLELCETLLKSLSAVYPRGALILFLSGRYAEVHGNTEEALVNFQKSISVQSEWRQLHHFCYWEMLWCSAFSTDWASAQRYADLLYHESKWSKSIYLYQSQVFNLMMDAQNQAELQKLSKAETAVRMKQYSAAFTNIPQLKQKIAGKVLPMERFATIRSNWFLKYGELPLPGLELVFVHNGFNIITKRLDLLTKLLGEVELHQTRLLDLCDKGAVPKMYMLIVFLLKGVVLKHIGRNCSGKESRGHLSQSEIHFNLILVDKAMSEVDAENKFIIPWTFVELADLKLHCHPSKAQDMLNQAKKYKDYILENRVLFRIHSLEQTLLKISNMSLASIESI